MHKNSFPFRFDASACGACRGKCCRGSSGYIWANLEEQEAIAKSFQMSLQEFQKKYVERVGEQYSFTEVQIDVDDYACVFFDLKEDKCSIYPLRPKQCRTYPFWKYFKKYPTEAFKECPGVYMSLSDCSRFRLT